MEVDLVLKAEFVCETLSVGAENPDGVSFVEEKECSVFFLEKNDVGKRAKVSVHGEDRFRDHQSTTFAGAEEFLELVQVVVWKDAKGGAGEPGGIDEAGVGELIENDGVVFTDKSRDRSDCGGVSIGEGERGLGFFTGGNSLFELMKEIERAAHEAGGGGPGTIVLDCFGGGLDEGGMLGETKVVVGGKIDELAAVDGDRWRRRRGNLLQGTKESLFFKVCEFFLGSEHKEGGALIVRSGRRFGNRELRLIVFILFLKNAAFQSVWNLSTLPCS